MKTFTNLYFDNKQSYSLFKLFYFIVPNLCSETMVSCALSDLCRVYDCVRSPFFDIPSGPQVCPVRGQRIAGVFPGISQVQRQNDHLYTDKDQRRGRQVRRYCTGRHSYLLVLVLYSDMVGL